jgi:hypothetical protein
VIEYRPTNPTRPPDWRWQLAGACLEAGVSPRGRAYDAQSRLAHRYRAAVAEAGPDEAALWAVYRRFPAAFEAHRIYANLDAHGQAGGSAGQQGRGPENFLKAELEARLLTYQPYPAVGARLGLHAETVAAYEALFFAVRDRLEQAGYVTHQVIGPRIYQRMSDSEVAVLWKLYGWGGGEYVLDAIIDHFNRRGRPQSREAVDAFFRDETGRSLVRKAEMATRIAPLSYETQQMMIGHYLQLVSIERNTEGGGGSTDTFLTNVEELMRNMRWKTGDKDDPPVTAGLPAPAGGAALRASELILASSGQIPAGLTHLLEDMRYPEPATPEAAHAAA